MLPSPAAYSAPILHENKSGNANDQYFVYKIARLLDLIVPLVAEGGVVVLHARTDFTFPPAAVLSYINAQTDTAPSAYVDLSLLDLASNYSELHYRSYIEMTATYHPPSSSTIRINRSVIFIEV